MTTERLDAARERLRARLEAVQVQYQSRWTATDYNDAVAVLDALEAAERREQMLHGKLEGAAADLEAAERERDEARQKLSDGIAVSIDTFAQYKAQRDEAVQLLRNVLDMKRQQAARNQARAFLAALEPKS